MNLRYIHTYNGKSNFVFSLFLLLSVAKRKRRMIELLIMKTAEATLLCRNFPFVLLIEPLEIPKLNRSTFESNKTLRDNALIIILSRFFDEDYTEEESYGL